ASSAARSAAAASAPASRPATTTGPTGAAAWAGGGAAAGGAGAALGAAGLGPRREATVRPPGSTRPSGRGMPTASGWECAVALARRGRRAAGRVAGAGQPAGDRGHVVAVVLPAAPDRARELEAAEAGGGDGHLHQQLRVVDDVADVLAGHGRLGARGLLGAL